MTRALSLPDFDEVGGTAQPVAPTQEPTTPEGAASEEDRLAVFEQGYRSGWDDCLAAETEERGRIAADLATNLRDLSASYESVRADVLSALGPLFDAVLSRLLPELVAEAVAPVVRDELLRIAQEASAASVDLVAAPVAVPRLENLVAQIPDLRIRLRPEPAYAEGQVSVRFGTERRDVDLSGAAQQMAEAIRDFTDGLTRHAPVAEPLPDIESQKGAA